MIYNFCKTIIYSECGCVTMKKNAASQDSDTQQYTFRIPVGLKAEMEQIAKKEDRSLAKQIIVALRQYIQERQAKTES